MVLITIAVSFVCSNAEAETTFRPVSGFKSVFVWKNSPCEQDFFPDAPARAFRRAGGEVVLAAPSGENWILTGHSLAGLKPNCNAVLRSSTQKNGAVFIEAIYTLDGRFERALVSHVLPDIKHRGCLNRGGGNCWLNDIIGATSLDGGNTFTIDSVVASVGNSYDPKQVGRVGYFTASNIVYQNGYYYDFIFFDLGNGPHGNCLIRTANIRSAWSWRAWDGQAFSQTVRSANADIPPCSPISPTILSHEVRSLSYLVSRKLWVAIFSDRAKLRGDKHRVAGVYMSTSKDLVHWEEETRILAIPQVKDPKLCNDFIRYPSLIDPESRSKNFDTIDSDTAALFFTYEHVTNCSGSLNRDLDYVAVRLEPSG